MDSNTGINYLWQLSAEIGNLPYWTQMAAVYEYVMPVVLKVQYRTITTGPTGTPATITRPLDALYSPTTDNDNIDERDVLNARGRGFSVHLNRNSSNHIYKLCNVTDGGQV